MLYNRASAVYPAYTSELARSQKETKETLAQVRRCYNLIGALAHIAEQTLDGIGGADVAMHARRSASTSLLPARSTPRAVRITVEST